MSSSIPNVPTSQFTGLPKGKMIDGRKKNRKRYTTVVLPPRMARGRMPRQAFSKPMKHASSLAPTMGDRIFDKGPITPRWTDKHGVVHVDPYLLS